jgi:UDP-N-acetylmuramate--alanine ligase
VIANGLLAFRGVGRRFEIVGEVNGITLVDDYAHHPTEIVATIRAAKEADRRRVIVVYQPHLYSRTRDFTAQFAEALSLADKCLLVDIYPAREQPIEGVTSEVIMHEAHERGIGDFEYVGPQENAPAAVARAARPGDIVITMGAGSITRIRTQVLEALGRK